MRYSNVLICFWLKKEPSVKYVRNCLGDGEGHPKCVQMCTGGRGMSRLMCTYTLTLSRFLFLAIFLSYSVLLYL